MRKHLLLATFILAFAPATFAQATRDYNKFEVYGGYSLGLFRTNVNSASFTSSMGTDTVTDLCSPATGANIGTNFQHFFCDRRKFNGLDASITYNVSRYVGIKGDFTGHFKSQSFTDVFNPPGATETVSNRERLYNVLGGVQVKDKNRAGRIKPFAHVLVGAARYTNRQQQTIDVAPQFNFTIEDRVTSFAMKLGGGLDLRAGRRFDLRLFEFDYNPVFAGDRRAKSIAGPFTDVRFAGRTAHNLTIGFGLVIH